MSSYDSAGSVIRRLNEDIKNNSFEHVYLLFGDEAYLRDQFRDNLISALMPAQPPMNYSHFSGNKINTDEVLSLASTVPFLAEHRLIVLEDTGYFKKSSDKLAGLIEKIPEAVYLIFVEDAVDKRGKMYKSVVRNGFPAEMTTPDDGMLRRWLIRHAEQYGCTMTDRTAQLMMNWCGRDMFLLHNEILKFTSFAGEGSEITGTIIRSLGIRELKDTIFKLTSALAFGKRNEAFDAYRELVGLETKPNQILYMLRREFKLVRMTKALYNRGENEKSIAKAARIHPAFVGRYLRAQRGFDDASLAAVIDELTEIQSGIHTGRADAQVALETFMMTHTKKERV